MEVNQRVTKPIKDSLHHLETCKEFNCDNPVDLFCVSWVAIRVSTAGATLLVHSWNEHMIPGKIQAINVKSKR